MQIRMRVVVMQLGDEIDKREASAISGAIVTDALSEHTRARRSRLSPKTNP